MAQPTDRMHSSGEADLVCRAIAKDEAAIRTIIARHNQRLFRLARGIVRDDGEAEDVLQDAYVSAFTSLATFRADSTLATWLTRIVVNAALQRLRRRTERPLDLAADVYDKPGNVVAFPFTSPPPDPERIVAHKQIAKLLEQAIDGLPDDFRTVLVARVFEDLSIEETADLLGIRPETVKTRLFRARRLLKEALAEHVDSMFADVFPFAGARCERLADSVVARLKDIG